MAQAPKVRNTQGLPVGFKVYSPFPFGGIDLKSSPLAMEDRRFYYLENFLKIGEGYLRTVWDTGPPVYTPPAGIVSFASYVLGEADYMVLFGEDGSAYQYAIAGGAITRLGSGSPFYHAGNIPCTTPWGSQYLLISNNNTPNDFWAWDGTLLYTAGTAAPNGAVLTGGGFNYSSTPTVTPYGGEGNGLVVEAVVSAGAVVQLNILNPGENYEVGDNVQLAFSGGGSDTGAILEAFLNPGGVGAVSISAGGSGYTHATIAFSGGGGTGAAGTVQISSGVSGVPVTAGGSNYTYAAVTFSGGGGTGAAATVVISGGVVTGIVVNDPGSGYTSAPTASISGTGTGATVGTVTIQNGVISGVLITSRGSGYTSAPSVAFSGDGTGAAGVALLSPSGVGGVNVVNGGSGYVSVPAISFVGGGGSGATGYVLLNGTSIASVNLTAGGSEYLQPPVVNFVGGGGAGAAAYCVMNGESVGAIVLTNGGAGYTGDVQVQIQLSPAQIAFNGALAQSNPNGLSPFTGAGAGGTVVLTPTSIASVQMSNSGTFYTNAPSVQIAPGSNNAAYATVTLMPYGVSGSLMETFQSVLFIGNPKPQPYATLPGGGNFQYSVPGGFTDFATADGGGLFVNSDRFLKKQYVGARQTNGYLYFLGDDSVAILSDLNTTGDPPTTKFTYQNVDPQIGMASLWRDTMQDFGRSVIFGNPTGVYGLYGGNVSKISPDLDRLFSNAVFPPAQGAIAPTGACAHIFNVKHYMMLMTIMDPDTGELRNVMATWNEKDWVITSQTVSLTYIATQEINSQLFAWGTDGHSLYQLFNAPSDTLTKRFDTKYYGADSQPLLKDLYSIQIVAQDQSRDLAGISGTLTAVVSVAAIPPNLTTRQEAMMPPQGSVVPQSSITIGALAYQAPAPQWPIWTSGTPGVSFNTIGFRFTTTAPDFVLGNFVVGYVPVTFAT